MVQDRQTHSLPATPEELRRFSVFMSYSDPARFARDLLGHLDRVHEAYAGLFSAAAGPPDAEAPPPRIETPGETGLQAQGFRDPAQVRAVVEAWQAGRPRALRSERARLLLGDILPALLASFSRLADPDAAFARLDQMLGRLPAGVQLLSLLQHNPALLDRLADVLGAAPSLADHLASVPSAIEGLLLPQDLEPDIGALLGLQLRDAAEVDDAVAIAARLVRGEEFRLAVAELDGRIDAERAGQARTALADAAIRALLPRVMADHVRRYGRLRGGGIAVVALGKAGSREMMAGSDLDLMLVYDHPPEVTESRGARPVPPSQYYARAANAIIAALTVQTRDGPLYSVDMRLRPSGSKGPVAVSLRAFETYHAHSAWTWERMALTRARVVAGPKKLQARVRAAIAAALRHPADPATLRADAAAMRARLLHELPPEGAWDVKLRPGGLLETEFIAQTLRLLRPAQPSGPGTLAMLQAARDAGCLPEADRRVPAEADLTWRSVQGLLRIMLGRRVPRVLPVPVLDRLAAHLGMPASEPILLSQLDEVAAAVRGLFLRHVGEPGGGAKDAYGREGRSG
jgi:glutamate-ammonia-ligase adenylyltransferase